MIQQVISGVLLLTVSTVCASAFAEKPCVPPATTFVTQFTATQEIPITNAKIELIANATVAPKDLSALMATLSTLKDANNNLLTLKSVDQNKTDSGVINVRATLEDIVPMAQTNLAYQFVNQHSGAGTVYTVNSINPYLSVDAQDQQKHQLELKLYKEAQQFAAKLSKLSQQNFMILSFNASGYQAPMPIQPMMMLAKTSNNSMDTLSTGQGMSVNQTLTLTAHVTYQAVLNKAIAQ